MRLAIVGTGISGLAAAYLANSHFEIKVFEQNHYPGGHSRTINFSDDLGQHIVDTGFIVFNQRNYPLLTALFKHLKVNCAPSNMSFAVSIDDGRLEYGTNDLLGICSQPSNMLRPKFWRMLRDILYFNRNAQALLNTNDPHLTLGQLLEKIGVGDWFSKYYLMAMGAAIWSTPLEKMHDFPAQTFIRFFANHGLLTVNQQPQWYTVRGGSREYVNKLTAPWLGRLCLNCGIRRIERHLKGVTLYDNQGQRHEFDKVILACHADQALSLLAQPSADEQQLLTCFKYQANHIIVHCDPTFMPKRRRAWASWVYLANSQQSSAQCSLSYWMNNLQPLTTTQPIFVTLNPSRAPLAELIIDEHVFHHPLFDESAINAQNALHTLQGQNHTYFCGAYQRYGFHEDGLLSAVNVCKQLGCHIPW